MTYREINTEDGIHDVIEELRVKYKNLSQVMTANEYQSTMGGKKVLTVYFRLEPVMKVEAEKDLLDAFVSSFREESKGYSSS